MLRLRDLRKKHGITMKELGAKIGVAESTISHYETGKREPDYETLLKLSEFFGVSVDYLLTGKEKEQPAANKEFSKRLQKARTEANLSQRAIAEKLYLSQQTYAKYETGDASPNPEVLGNISRILKVPADCLLGLTDDAVYAEPNSSRILTNRPIDILVGQYHMQYETLCAITGADLGTVEEWISGEKFPSENELQALAEFFEVSKEDLQVGRLPLFSSEAVLEKVWRMQSPLFAAYGKDGDFTPEDRKKINEYAELVRAARRSKEEKHER